MKALLYSLACLCVTTSGFARLGETFAECETRYGNYRGRTGEKHIFVKNQIGVECVFGADGKCLLIRFFPSGIPDLTDGMIDALIESNMAVVGWRELNDKDSTPADKARVNELLEAAGGRDWADMNRRGRNWSAADQSMWAVFREKALVIATAAALDTYRAMGKKQAEGF